MNDRIKDDGGPAFPQPVAEIHGRATNGEAVVKAEGR